MTVTVEKLRLWLLMGAGLLVIVIGGFLGYAHYRAHRFLTGLPARLGVDIKQETNAFTYSQTVQGRTVFTIHAAKAIQRKDGKVTLRDVRIVLYGRKQDRSDRIYGDEFEYDQNEGVVKAMNEVHIDLEAPAANDAKARTADAAGKGQDVHGDPRVIHVKTSGLVFLQKLGVAATEKDIEFETGGMTGHALGAEYNSDTGVLVLEHNVQVNGLQHGQPVILTAAQANVDRTNELVVLQTAKIVSVSDTDTGERRTLSANHALVHLSNDGTPQRVDADGSVSLKSGDGIVTAPRAEMLLGKTGRLQRAHMMGGVHYTEDGPARKANGEGQDGVASFDEAGRLERVEMDGGVHMVEQPLAGGSRDVRARSVAMMMRAGAGGKTELREVKADGGAVLHVVSEAEQGKRLQSEMRADAMTAEFVTAGGEQRIQTVHGAGHTLLQRTNEMGAVDTSAGDMLDARFDTTKKGNGGASQIASAVQQGAVVMTHTAAAKTGSAAEEHATAERAEYDGGTQRVTLTGHVQLVDAGSVLLANRVVTDQVTNDGTADGSVKATYRQVDTAEPVHVLAARAEFKRSAQQAIFYGVGGGLARLWQGGSQVEAPVLEFDQAKKKLVARGEGGATAPTVHTVLVSGGKGNMAAGKSQVVRVTSAGMTYTEAARTAEFTDGVLVNGADGSMRGREAEVLLESAGAKAAGSAAAQSAKVVFPAGGVERIVVNGDIHIDQPGRRATGEQVVYTATDGTYLLKGTTARPPQVVDDVRGTVTGAALRFRAGDDSVVVSGAESGGTGQRVRTETRVKQ